MSTATLETAAPAAPDPERLDALLGRMLGDLGAAYILPLVRIGDELGLYAALAEGGPATPAALPHHTGAQERLLREWLSAHAAAGYVEHDAASGRFSMTPEQATVFARPDSPAFMLGAFEVAYANTLDVPMVARAFRGDGRGAGYHGRCACLFSGIERFFRPGYAANLVESWLPALDGVVAKLERGALVADVGCGHGASAILMAQAFPRSRFSGFDYHAASVACARDAAARAGVSANTSFEAAGAADFPGAGFYDLVACFDALHDMGDPVGVARHIRAALAPDGTFMAVEPRAGDRLEDNMNPVGRLYYAASTMICTPVALDQAPDGPALGAQAGPARLRAVLHEAGFSRVRVVAETPFNIVIEARP